MTRWIAGIDGSDDSRTALQWAAAMAHARGERVEPVSSWHLPLPLWLASGKRVIEVDRMGLQAEAEVVASDVVDGVEPAEVVDAPVVVEGHPSDVLLERAGPDRVVVVGRRGISALKHRLVGSVSHDLVTHADGPVVVVPAGWSPTSCRRVVVGFDGSEHAATALRWAIDTMPADAEIVASIAVDVIPWLSPELGVERHPDDVEHAKQRLLAEAEAVDPAHRAVRSINADGVRGTLSEHFEGTDLIVVGPRGLGGVGRTLLGSVTTWLLQTAPCPLAVVPTPELD